MSQPPPEPADLPPLTAADIDAMTDAELDAALAHELAALDAARRDNRRRLRDAVAPVASRVIRLLCPYVPPHKLPFILAAAEAELARRVGEPVPLDLGQ